MQVFYEGNTYERNLQVSRWGREGKTEEDKKGMILGKAHLNHIFSITLQENIPLGVGILLQCLFQYGP